MNLHTAQHADGTWWVEGLPAYRVNGERCTSCGPYDTRREADSDRRGLERFYKANPEYAAGDAEACDAVPSGTHGSRFAARSAKRNDSCSDGGNDA